MSAIHHTKAYLEQQLQKNEEDCCFCQSLTGANKVDTFTQTYLNWGFSRQLPDGSCVPVKAGCKFLGKTLTCSKLHNPEPNSDSAEERAKRCGLSCLGCVCGLSLVCTVPTLLYTASELMKANSQWKSIGPKPQRMV